MRRKENMDDAVTKWSDKLDAFHIGLICGVLGIIPQGDRRHFIPIPAGASTTIPL
jgi:hypothetical protein